MRKRVLTLPVAQSADDGDHETLRGKTECRPGVIARQRLGHSHDSVAEDEGALGAVELRRGRRGNAGKGIGTEQLTPEQRPKPTPQPPSGAVVDLSHVSDVGCPGS